MTILATECAVVGGAGSSIPVLDLGTAQQVSLTTGASAASAAVGTTTTIITVWSDVRFYIASGAAPTAATTGFAVPENTLFDIKASPGVTKIAGRAVSSAGTLYMVERT